jgi:hypothetical protein
MPRRIQRQRSKGWRKGSAVIVTRPGRWDIVISSERSAKSSWVGRK